MWYLFKGFFCFVQTVAISLHFRSAPFSICITHCSQQIYPYLRWIQIISGHAFQVNSIHVLYTQCDHPFRPYLSLKPLLLPHWHWQWAWDFEQPSSAPLQSALHLLMPGSMLPGEPLPYSACNNLVTMAHVAGCKVIASYSTCPAVHLLFRPIHTHDLRLV